MFFIPLDDWLDGIVFHKNLSLELCEFFFNSFVVVFFKTNFFKRNHLHKNIIVLKFQIKPFHATHLFRYPLKTLRKPLVFWCFQGVSKVIIGMKWVKAILKYAS